MTKIELIEKSRSVREYRNKPLAREDLQLVRSLLASPYPMEMKGRVEIAFLEDGKEVFAQLEGLAGYGGRMIEAPHYLVLFCEADGVSFRGGGFIGQNIILRLMQGSIGTCWISVESPDAVKEALHLPGDKQVAALIALGYPREEKFFEKIFGGIKAVKTPYSQTGYADFRFEYEEDTRQPLGVSTLVYVDEWGRAADADELERRGFLHVYHYMKYAPSWGNRRPWKFILQDENIIMAVKCKGDKEQLDDHLEGGIAMFFFQLAMHEMGFRGGWVMEASAHTPDGYLLAGQFVSE